MDRPFRSLEDEPVSLTEIGSRAIIEFLEELSSRQLPASDI